MRQMRTMDHMMNSMFQDSFGMGGMFRDFGNPRAGMHSLMSPFGMMSNFNRLMSSPLDPMAGPIGNCNYSSSSTVISMTSGPDGHPQVQNTYFLCGFVLIMFLINRYTKPHLAQKWAQVV